MSLFKITFFVPTTHVDEVKLAMFKAGAGKIGNYDMCAFQTLGQGQFRPLEESNAYIGEIGKFQDLDEYRVEMICDQQYVKAAMQALIDSHPYEEPAYDVLETVDWQKL